MNLVLTAKQCIFHTCIFWPRFKAHKYYIHFCFSHTALHRIHLPCTWSREIDVKGNWYSPWLQLDQMRYAWRVQGKMASSLSHHNVRSAREDLPIMMTKTVEILFNNYKTTLIFHAYKGFLNVSPSSFSLLPICILFAQNAWWCLQPSLA